MDNPTIKLFATKNTWIESRALDQVKAISRLAGVTHIAAMPDLHPGRGIAVGAVTVTKEVIYPHIIGNDIGCGIDLFETGCEKRSFKSDRIVHKLERLSSEDRHSGNQSLDPAESGSLGGGNHFAEFQSVENVADEELFHRTGISRKKVILLVHSGSRGFGEQIYTHFIRAYSAQNGLAAGSAAFDEYFELHDKALAAASRNRALVAKQIAHACGFDISDAPLAASMHNLLEKKTVGTEELYLHRKGAAAAGTQPVVIAGSRGALSYLVMPVNSGIENGFSLAHGAGRKWGRSECRGRLDRKYTRESITRTAIGSRVVCDNSDLLFEEAPEAYKDIATVIADLEAFGLIRVIASLRPLVTYKG